MTKGIVLAAVAAAALLGAPAAAALVNGSFEDSTNFVPDGNNTMSLAAGSTAMTGWTVIGDSLAWIGTPNPFGGLMPSDGSFFLDLTDYPNGAPFGGVQQVLSTVAGHNYEVKFDLGSHAGSGISSIDASAAGKSRTFTSSVPIAASVWETQTFTFTANAANTALSLLGSGGTDYIGLDNVIVTDLGPAVPEPATWAMMLGGFGMLGCAARRRSVRRVSLP